jgi:hypothetical protein
MQPEPRRAPTAMEGPPTPMAAMKSRFETARGRARTARHAATKFARSYMREVTTAAKASREPMQALWHNVRMAGRHIARDAKAMWHEVAPMRMESMKLPGVRRRRPAA